ncbi:MAG TPA: SRPBCC family protein [Solirubrobacteraceae bacterium]
MPRDGHAILEDHEGRNALRFERTLLHTPERVWRALTSSDELSHWHPTPFELDASPPIPGCAVRFITAEGGPEIPAGELLQYEPPRALAYTWGEDELRWELRPDGAGCVLRLTHVFDDRFKAARDGTGWHMCLAALSESLDGSPQPKRGSAPHLPEGWEELNREYQQRFGIAPEQATPPPL